MKVGIDNVLIDRMEKVSPSFPKKILSKKEFEQYEKSKSKKEFLAGRFAGKEAYMKASGNLFKKYDEIEILDDENGKPRLYIENKEEGDISITHDYIATAIVIL